MTKPTAAAIITAGVNLLRAGTLPSALPARLMADYQLTHTEAQRLAGRAVDRWRAHLRPRGEQRPE